jgi:hypothetical protein
MMQDHAEPLDAALDRVIEGMVAVRGPLAGISLPPRTRHASSSRWALGAPLPSLAVVLALAAAGGTAFWLTRAGVVDPPPPIATAPAVWEIAPLVATVVAEPAGAEAPAPVAAPPPRSPRAPSRDSAAATMLPAVVDRGPAALAVDALVVPALAVPSLSLAPLAVEAIVVTPLEVPAAGQEEKE